MIGALLGNFGGAVDIARTARGNVQNGRLGSSGTLGEKKLTTPYADVLRNTEQTTPYTDMGNSAKLSTPYANALSRAGISSANSSTVSETQLSTPYADALAQVMQQQQQGSAPGSDVISRNGAAGEQVISYAEATRRLQAEEEATAAGVDAIQTDASEYARYKDLDRKYLNGILKTEEFEELRRLDNIWGQYDEASERAKANGTLEHDRYLELERKFRNGNITEQELHEWIALEDALKQFNESKTLNDFKKKEVETFRNSSIILSGGVLDEFDRKSTWMEYDEDIARVNPNYSTNEFEWQNNCQRCVSAYEMRRRGFDVTAKPLSTTNLEDDPLAQHVEYAWKDAIRHWCMKENGRAQAEAFMKAWGDGARAIVGVGFRGRFGHVFIAEQKNGKTIYIDPQNGSTDCSSYFEYAVKGQTYIVRIDTLTPTNAILDCCKNRR